MEKKQAESPRMNPRKTTITILATLSVSIALADDFKTNDGKEHKSATVTQVEADGIVIKTKGGISKLYFTELPKDVQERFHYDPAQAAAAQAAAIRQTQELNQFNSQQEELAKQQKAASAKQVPAGARATGEIQQRSGTDRPIKYFAAARTKFARADWASGEKKRRGMAEVG